MSTFEKILGQHCGLAMVGIKAANLVCLKHKDFADIHGEICLLGEALSPAGIVLRVLDDNGNRILLLVYREKALEQRLSEPDARRLLTRFGYPDGVGVDALIDRLSGGFRKGGGFPHEIGIFLGYPAEDVIGFIRNPDGCKMCGAWKVYGDVNKAKETFARYEKCSAAIKRRMDRGDDLKTIFAKAI